MEQPGGYEVKTKIKLVYKLIKSLYGLKQSGRNWNKMLDEYVIENGFKQNQLITVFTQEREEMKR